MNPIVQNLHQLSQRIEKACQKAGRTPNEIKVVLATKTVAPEHIKIALQNGFTVIAENKVQELTGKFEALKTIPHTKHFIGHLQTNKVKPLLNCNVSCIQSLDRMSLAQKLHQCLLLNKQTIDVLIQVNTSGEESKFGVSPQHAIELINQVSQFNTLKIKGLMTIGLFSSDIPKVRKCFQLLQKLQQQISAEKIPNVTMQELSMGMSGDLETAIEEGATIIRVGTAIFGQRIYPDSYYWNENTA